MTTIPDPTPNDGDDGTRSVVDELDDAALPPPPVPRLRRDPNTPLAGVATGIAHYFGLDPTLVRLLFVIAVFFGGLGFFVYLGGWALIPHSNHPDSRPVVLNGGLASLVIGSLAAIGALSVMFGSGTFAAGFVGPAILVGIGFYLLNQRQLVTTEASPTAGGGNRWGSVFTEPAPRGTGGGRPFSPGPPPPGPVPAPKPTEPGPPITAVTLALVAVAVGALATLDQLTSVSIGAVAVFGTATAIIGAGLVASAFLGRALGLYFFGLVALAGLVVSPVVDAATDGGFGNRTYTLDRQQDLRSSYELGTGELILDMRAVDFADDDTVRVDLGAGAVRVFVPDDVTIDLDARSAFGVVHGPLGDTDDGVGARLERRYTGREGAPTLTLDLDVTFGGVEVSRG